MTTCPPDCDCRGTGEEDWGAELLETLRDVRSQRTRDNLIAWHTADYVACPHCKVPPGTACVTFPRGRNATFTHMKRVNARLAAITGNRAN